MNYTPPIHSRRDVGDVRTAELLPFRLQHPEKKRSAAQRLGISYERKALAHLAIELPHEVLNHPAFRFRSAGKAFDEHAIPDAIYLAKSVLTIFEIKIRHTADAWYQLRKLYLPVVQKAYPGYAINLVEVCKGFDPSIRLQGEVQLVEDLDSFTSEARIAFGIYLWSGRT